MNKGPDDNIASANAWQKHDRSLFLGPCFDLDLNATQAMEAFESKKKLQTHCTPVTAEPQKPKVSLP